MYQNNYNYNYNQPPYMPPQQDAYTKQMLYYNQKKRNQKYSIIVDGFIMGGTIILYLVVQALIVMALQKSEYYSMYTNSPAFQYAFNIIAVHLFSLAIPFTIMARILKKRFVGPLVPTKHVKPLSLFAWVSLGMGVTLGASIFTNFIIELVKKGGYELSQPEFETPKTAISFFIMFVSIALVPAIFEEYAFRCCALGALKGRGKAFAVIAVSILFGLIHGNVIQFIFAFIVGLICGYITIATDSVIPAMIVHGCNNALSVISEVLKYYSGKQIATYVINVIVITWAVLCVLGFIYLLINRELIVRDKKSVQEKMGELSLGAKLACLLPGLALPIIILIVFTTQYIKPIG